MDLQQLKDAIRSRENQIESYEQYSKVLITGCDSTSELLQQVSSSKSGSIMMKLSQIAVDDSAAIRVITIITMLYLGPTAIGVSQHCARMNYAKGLQQTIMDMPLFSLDKNGLLVVSHQIWIFVVIALGLTAGTFAYWQFQLRRRSRYRSHVFNGQSTESQSSV